MGLGIEIYLIEHMVEHHEFLAHYWWNVAYNVKSDEIMYRRAKLKSEYHIRRANVFRRKREEARHHA